MTLKHDGICAWVSISNPDAVASRIERAESNLLRLERRVETLESAIKQAYELIEKGMEIRAKSLLGSVLDAGLILYETRAPFDRIDARLSAANAGSQSPICTCKEERLIDCGPDCRCYHHTPDPYASSLTPPNQALKEI